MSTVLWIALLWAGFAGTHILMSSTRVRPRLVGVLGEGGYLGLFSLVAAVLLVPASWLYFTHKATSPWLWTLERSTPLLWSVYLGVGLAFVFIASSFANPRVPGREVEPGGIYRITRHPLVMGIALWALLHLLPNGRSVDLAWFGGFTAFAVIGCWHQDRRKLAEGAPAFRRLYEVTPFWPFTGRVRSTLQGVRELSPYAVGAGIAAAVGLRHVHDALFR